ncbi:MAG: hypothetical protein QOD99_2691 [Chthoniobacter sp.]|nr:hypothetical protein [Chthoniobacter sp.]
MKIHDDIEEWLAASVTDGLSEEERNVFEQHLAECRRCRALHAEEKIMSNAITGMFGTVEPDGNFETRIAQGFRRRISSRPRFHFGEWLLHFGQMPSVRWATALLLLAAMVKGGALLTGERFAAISSQSAAAHGGESHRFAAPVSASDQLGNEAFSRDRELSSYSSSVDLGAVSQTSAAAPQLEVAKQLAGASRVGGSGGSSAYFKDESQRRETKSVSELKPADSKDADFSVAQKAKEPIGMLAFDGAANVPGVVTAAPAQQPALQPATPPTGPAASPLQENRKLIRNAALEFEVKSFDAAVEAIRSITNEDEGYVATSDSARGANGKLRGTVVVKMLPANLDKFLLQLRSLGELKNQKLGSEDVTKAYFDTEARLRNSKRMEERLLDMLQKSTGKVSELLQVEKELARVREEIERMQGELKYWDALVGYATVTISLYEKDLNQAAAFLLKERANLSLFSPDVEKTYAEAKREAVEAKAQVLQSKLDRDANGRVTATLSLLFEPELADRSIARMKTLGRVQTFTTQDERVAQGGSGASDSARVERDKVEFNLVIAHDDESRRQTNATVVTPQVEASFDKAKAAALAQQAEIVHSNVSRNPQGRSTGQLSLRVAAQRYEALLEEVRKLGRLASLAVQRDDRAGDDDTEPVLLSLAFTSEETPVQLTNLNLLSESVEQKAAALKQAAAGAGVELKNSTFERQSGGSEVANLTFLLPLKGYAPFVEQIKRLGKVTNFTVHRSDSADGASDSAPAQIDVQIYSRGDIVPDENGITATLRRTFVQAFSVIMWSVRMIAVALAFIAPWALAAAVVVWIVIRSRRSRRDGR